MSQLALAAGYPLNGSWELVDPKSWTYENMQKKAPGGFVCGYVVNDAWGNNYFSMYVVKKGNKYELIYKKTGIVKTKDIDATLAKELLKTVDGNIGEAQKRRDFEIEEAKKRLEKKEADETEDVEVIWSIFYDGDVIYALKPGKMAYSWPDVFYRLSDKNWNDQMAILSDAQASDNQDIRVEFFDVDKENNYSSNGDIVDEEIFYIDEPLDTNAIYFVVEDFPEFPGGPQALADYLRDNIKYPELCRKDSIQGRVIITFVVEKDGSISSAEVVKGIHELLDAEAMRVISAMPKWKPGKHRGKAVRVKYAIPVNFRLDGTPYLKVPKSSAEKIDNKTAEIIEIFEEDSYIE
jgi:TonB family protein